MFEQNNAAQNPMSEWLRFQMEFQAKLADETFRYLRRLQGATAPVTPGTVLLPETGTDLNAHAQPGGAFEVTLEIKNYQRVHTVAAPSLEPLVSPSGTTWYPEADFSPAFALIAPDESVNLTIRVSVPAAIPLGTYTGALSLRGLGQPTFRLTVEVGKDVPAPPKKADVSAVNKGTKVRAKSVDRKPAAKKKAKPRKTRTS